MHFELPRDFSSLFLALRELTECGVRIDANSVTEELLAGDALDTDGRANLVSEVATTLLTLSRLPLFQSERQGGICPDCGAHTPFAERTFLKQFLEGSPQLWCLECSRASARTAWGWTGTYRLVAGPTLPEGDGLP